jgi:hypothetical protein
LRNAPPEERDGAAYKADLGLRKIRIFFQKGLDRGGQKQPDGQISWQPARQITLEAGHENRGSP